MKEQELIIEISKVKKERFLSRVAILAALVVIVALNLVVGIELKYLGIGYFVFCTAIMVLIGFPTQKKLGVYEAQLKRLEEV